MKSEFTTLFKNPKPQKLTRDRYLLSRTTADPWNVPDKPLDRSIDNKPLYPDRYLKYESENLTENFVGASPKLHINESSTRHMPIDIKSPKSTFQSNPFESTIPDNFSSYSAKQASTTPSLHMFSRISSFDPQTVRSTDIFASGPKKTSPKSKSTIKFRTNDEIQNIISTDCWEEVKKLSQPNHMSQPINVLEERTLNRTHPKPSNGEKKPLLKVTCQKQIKDIQQLTGGPRFFEAGLANKNLLVNSQRVPAFTGKEQVPYSFALNGKSYNSPVKKVTEDSPSRYDDSPPVRVNAVRAMKKKRPKNSSKEDYGSKISDSGDRKGTPKGRQVDMMKEMKLMGNFGRSAFADTIPKWGGDQETVTKKSSYAQMLDLVEKKTDWTPADVKILEPNKQSSEGRSVSTSADEKITSRRSRASEKLEDVRIFREVLDFLPVTSLCQMTRVCKKFRSVECLSLIKKAQCRLIIKGLDDEDQYGFWDFFVNFDYLQRTYPLQYMMSAMKPCAFERDILSDLDRTRDFDQLTPAKQNSLMKILVAFANAVPKIGYIQGLNSITAVFLCHKVTESEVYWLMKYIFKKKKFDEVLSDNFSKVQLLTYQLEIYMRNYLPETIDYLGENGMNVSYFATQWFITMFSYDLELSHLTKIWNLFLIKGWKVLIRVALTILWHFQDEICSKSADELPSYLKSFVREKINEISEQELFSVGLSFKVCNRLLKNLETLYDHSAPINVIFVSNDDGKLECKILPEVCAASDISKSTQKDMMEYLNENLDQMRNLNKMKGNVHNEIDNYRSIAPEFGNTSLDVSVDNRSSTKSLHGSQQMLKSSDQSFIQTLSSFGRKLKQILTPKEAGQDIFGQQRRIPSAKLLDFTSEKDPLESYGPLTERSNGRSNALNSRACKLIVANDTSGAPAFQKSIVNALKCSNDKLGINLFDPLNFSVQRDRDTSRQLHTSKTNTASTNDLLEHLNKQLLSADLNGIKHRRNSSFNQDLMMSFKSQQSLNLEKLISDRKYDERKPIQNRYADHNLSTDIKHGDLNKSVQLPGAPKRSLMMERSYTALPGYTEHENVDLKAMPVEVKKRYNLNWDLGEHKNIFESGENRRYSRTVGVTIPEETH